MTSLISTHTSRLPPPFFPHSLRPTILQSSRCIAPSSFLRAIYDLRPILLLDVLSEQPVGFDLVTAITVLPEQVMADAATRVSVLVYA